MNTDLTDEAEEDKAEVGEGHTTCPSVPLILRDRYLLPFPGISNLNLQNASTYLCGGNISSLNINFNSFVDNAYTTPQTSEGLPATGWMA